MEQAITESTPTKEEPKEIPFASRRVAPSPTVRNVKQVNPSVTE